VARGGRFVAQKGLKLQKRKKNTFLDEGRDLIKYKKTSDFNFRLGKEQRSNRRGSIVLRKKNGKNEKKKTSLECGHPERPGWKTTDVRARGTTMSGPSPESHKRKEEYKKKYNNASW